MIDFNKITSTELAQLKLIASKASEKGELDTYYLFTQDPLEKTRVFMFCHRLLISINNLIVDGSLRTAIQDTIKETSYLYKTLDESINSYENGPTYGKNYLYKKIHRLSGKRQVSEMIDLFSVLIEKAHVLSVTKLKGVVMEGKSGLEYQKIQKEFKKTS